LAPAQEERTSRLRIARDAGRHRHVLHGGLVPPVVIGVGRRPIEVARRPPGIAHGHPPAVGPGSELPAPFGQRARGPLRDGAVVGHVDARARAAGGQQRERGRAQRPARGRATVHENLMSAVPSYRAPVVSKNSTLSWPGSVALNVNEKNGFYDTLWVVSKTATVLPR